MSITYGELVTEAKEEAEMVNSNFISSAAWLRFANREGGRLHNLLAGVYEDYWHEKVEIEVAANQERVALPEDFFKSRKVFWKTGATTLARMRPFHLSALDSSTEIETSVDTGVDCRYAILGRFLYLRPWSTQAGTVQLWYVPTFKKFNGDHRQPLPLPMPHGFEDYLIAGMAARAAAREERFDRATYLRGTQSAVAAEIRNYATNRDAGEVQTVQDLTPQGEGHSYYDY